MGGGGPGLRPPPHPPPTPRRPGWKTRFSPGGGAVGATVGGDGGVIDEGVTDFLGIDFLGIDLLGLGPVGVLQSTEPCRSAAPLWGSPSSWEANRGVYTALEPGKGGGGQDFTTPATHPEINN